MEKEIDYKDPMGIEGKADVVNPIRDVEFLKLVDALPVSRRRKTELVNEFKKIVKSIGG